jgi:hypothetical protein
MMAVAKRGSAKIITPGRRLDQVRAGARAHHQEEGVLDLAVQPDDAGEAAEHLALAALAQHGARRRTGSAIADRDDGDSRRSCQAPAGGRGLAAARRAASGGTAWR